MQCSNVATEPSTPAVNLKIPSAPGRTPFWGHSIPLLTRPLEFLCSLESVGPVVRVEIGRRCMVVVTDPQLTMQVLQDSQTFDKGGIFFDKVFELTGESLLTVKHAGHKRQRRLVQPAFTRQRVEEYSSAMGSSISDVLGDWRDGEIVDVVAVVYDITSRVAAKTMFAADVAGSAVSKVVNALAVYLKGLFVRMWAPRRLINLLPLPSNSEYDAALKVLNDTVGEIIESYKRSGIDHGDLLSMLLAARDHDTGAALTEDEIHSQVMTLFLAGIETTASALTWAFYLLGRHPAIAEEMNSEVDSVLQGRAPAWDDLRKLEVTGRIVSEALRLYPPTWVFTRATTKEVALGSHVLAPGVDVAYSPYLLHRSPANFDKPDEFRPDRWLSENLANVPRGAFVPFGSGAHRCIGESFAMTEIVMALAAIASEWSLNPTSNEAVIPIPRRATLTPGRLPMRLQRRREA